MKNIIILIVLLNLSFGNHPILDSLTSKILAPGVSSMDLEIVQMQYDEEWKESVTIEVVDSQQFIFSSPKQIIKVHGDLIYTFNSKAKQVVIDQIPADEFSIFDLLRGKFDGIQIEKIEADSELTLIEFIIESMNIPGMIWINTDSYLPKRIRLQYDEINHFDVQVISFKNQLKKSIYNNYSTPGWEIIDLRN